MRYSLPRRRRLGDPLASPRKIEQLLKQLVGALRPQLAAQIDLESIERGNFEPVVQLLQAASNYVRAQAGVQSRAGKPNRFSRALLSNVVEAMTRILNRESQGRISFRTFTDNNLRILGCPDDIKNLLEEGRITLFEALQLKRLSPESLSLDPEQALAVRIEFLARCRRERWIAHRLRHEIDRRLGKRNEEKPQATSSPALHPDEPAMSDFERDSDSPPSVSQDSFFAEQLTLMVELLQTIEPDQLEKTELERLLNSIDDILLQLQRIRRRQKMKNSVKRNQALGFI
jgi:hypothetical protein